MQKLCLVAGFASAHLYPFGYRTHTPVKRDLRKAETVELKQIRFFTVTLKLTPKNTEQLFEEIVAFRDPEQMLAPPQESETRARY